MSALRVIGTLLAVEGGPADARRFEEEVAAARAQLEAALAALRRARDAWGGGGQVDTEALRRALDAAERQLDEARVRLHRALGRGD